MPPDVTLSDEERALLVKDLTGVEYQKEIQAHLKSKGEKVPSIEQIDATLNPEFVEPEY